MTGKTTDNPLCGADGVGALHVLLACIQGLFHEMFVVGVRQVVRHALQNKNKNKTIKHDTGWSCIA